MWIDIQKKIAKERKLKCDVEMIGLLSVFAGFSIIVSYLYGFGCVCERARACVWSETDKFSSERLLCRTKADNEELSTMCFDNAPSA